MSESPLPVSLARLVFHPEGHDPFAGVLPSDPLSLSVDDTDVRRALPQGPALTSQSALPGPALAPASAPPVSYRYLGTFVGPGGQPLVFVANGESHQEIRAGSPLADGYTVESIGPAVIRLRHPLLDGLAEIPMPPIGEAGG